ncbi:MAG: DUF2459 domain-containing protein [Gammaproteobacteria bacterium]|nr:DUF2459 domain-containing protein [Gammaproteobacteria bacterium]
MATLFMTASGCKPITGSDRVLTPPGAPNPAATVGFIRNGWHTGLVLPAAELKGPIHTLTHWFPTARYVEIGWGQRPFYTTRHPGPWTALRALFPSPSVLYVKGLRHVPRAPHLLWRALSARGLHGLQQFLGHTFRHGPHEALEPVRSDGVYAGLFFRARGTYDALHTCNTWTIAALHHAGLPVHSAGVIFAGQAATAVHDAGAPVRHRSLP